MTKRLAGFTGWCDRWLNNGANLITLSRLPMIAVILTAILPVAEYLPEWYWVLGANAIGIFWLGAIAQVIGMITDGLDGFYAKKISSVGSTSEGKFLDQFVDKLFIWIVWGALTWTLTFYCGWWVLLYWYLPSAYLFFLDARSCLKHWRNYCSTRGKEVNDKHGAVLQGKIKFCIENVVVCASFLGLCPLVVEPFLWYEWLSYVAFYVGWYGQISAFLWILLAIYLARDSLKSRGVIKKKAPKDKSSPISEELQRVDHPQ